jgi:putative ABC transport system permease protein
MMPGLTRQALRSNPWSFVGPFTTQGLAAALVAGSLGAQHSIAMAPLTAPGRQALADGGVPEMAVIFLMIAIYLSAILVGVTMSSSIARQAQDIALIRSIGASPWQVRRSVALQAAVVAVPATLAGVPLGILGGRAWIDGLVAHGVVPDGVRFHPHVAALPIALAVTVGTSLLGALISAIRPSRVRPSVALTETAAPRRRVGVVRTGLGVVLVAGGVVLSVVISRLDAAAADDAAFFVMLALCVGAGLLGPVLLRVAAPVARLFGPAGRMVADNLAVRAKAYSGALVPLTLAVAFTAVKVLMHTTAAHATGTPEPRADLWTDYSGTAVYVAFAAVAALNTLISVVLGRRRDLAVTRLAGGTQARVLAVLTGEALIVTGTAVVTAAAVALTVLRPVLHTAFGTWSPWLPASYLVIGLLATYALVLAGIVVPGALTMRRPAIEAVEG